MTEEDQKLDIGLKKVVRKRKGSGVRVPTSTSTFGSKKRESHDSSEFYRRFKPPIISTEGEINVLNDELLNSVWCQDSRDLSFIPSNSVALVVTSPPYYVGKSYENETDNEHVASSYVEFLEILKDVFSECLRVLEPGGRVAINVANLGRKPYRSLANDILTILQDDLGMLLRGEILWIKSKGASGSCAWGSFSSASNPVLRDVSERVLVASKGSFSRVPDRKKREKMGLPFENSIDSKDFVNWTLDTWYIPPESAKKIRHPAPFPIELPKRLIELFTYKGDVVLDPFCGSGQSAIAALQLNRHYICVDAMEEYVELAKTRIGSSANLFNI